MTRFEPPLTDVVELSDGVRLFFGEWPGDDPTFVFAPGLTSTHRGIAGPAASMEGVRVIAPDLRGRGNSSKPPAGSYGMPQHADDILQLADALGIERFVVGGHSMGAYVATAVAVRAPERVLGLVLLDGGVLVVPPGVEMPDPDVTLETVLAHHMSRLRRSYASIEEYFASWETTGELEPPFGELERSYLLYALGRGHDGYRMKCTVDAARDDWRDLLTDPEIVTRLDRITCPVLAIGAEYGLAPGTPSVLSDIHLDRLRDAVGDVAFVRVPGTSHASVAQSEPGAIVTGEAIRTFVSQLA